MGKSIIGIFDSGMGGLTAMSSLCELLPGEDMIYFGDTGHNPYGGRSRDQLVYMARQNIAFLEGLGAKLVLAACGTVTSVALETVTNETKTPLFGVAQSAAERAGLLTKNRKIGFIATQACVDSGFNQALLRRVIPGVEVIDRACPKFVPLIESGVCSPDSEELNIAIHEYLSDIKSAGADVLILGCTHYPIIADAIGRYLGDKVHLVSSSAEAAKALAEVYSSEIPDEGAQGKGKHTYYTSGDAEKFRQTAFKLLGRELDGEVISVEPYPLI